RRSVRRFLSRASRKRVARMNAIADFLGMLTWLDGRPLMQIMEPYRLRIFERALERDEAGQFRHNLIVCGRAKKNFKTADAVLFAFYKLLDTAPQGNQVYV